MVRGLPALADIGAADLVGNDIADQDEQQHAHGDGVGHLVIALLGIGEGQEGHGPGGGRHHDDDQVQLLGDGDEGQHKAGDEAVLCQGDDDGAHPLPEAGARDVRRLLQLHADGEHVGGTGPAGEGEVLDHGGQNDQSEGAVQGGDQAAQMGDAEHGEVHG